MRLTSKKITSFLLTGILLAPMAYVYLFQIQQQSIQSKMKERLKNKILHAVILPGHNIPWSNNGKEIRIDGRLFDVKSVIYKNDGSAVFTGLYDDEETQLVRQLEKNQKENNTEGNKQIVQFFQFQLSMPENILNNDAGPAGPSTWPRPANYTIHSSDIKDILTPPPQA